MKRLTEIDRERAARLLGLFADLDDTISTDGKLTPDAYGALWRLSRAGLRLVIVTGRPAGWCDHIARFWPVDAVVGENGGFYFFHDGSRMHRRYLYDEVERAAFRERLGAVGRRILEAVPGAAIAADQAFREYDLAIDFREDVPPLPSDQVARIRRLFEEAGARAKISSIHVNGWYGDFDKLSTARLWARERLQLDLDAERDRFAYLGDSPNDEPMFAHFPFSIGVANVRRFLPIMKSLPAYVTDAECGAGFVEAAEAILACFMRQGALEKV